MSINWLGFFAEISRDHAAIQGYDRNQVAANERFQCADCHRTMLLTIYGKCGVCNSSAVTPVAVIEASRG